MTTQSTSTSTSTAKAMADAQRRADKAHHEKRVNWLMGTNPVYACGTRVAPSDVARSAATNSRAVMISARRAAHS